jgi:hypothetical protein
MDEELHLMTSPTDASFHTREELKEYLCTWAKLQGYALSIKRSEEDKKILFCKQ